MKRHAVADLERKLRCRAQCVLRKAVFVNDSLSIILPVRDCQATLSHQVHHLLEVVPDLTSRFEIIIVDDGSTDHTPDIAHELARAYPQLRLIRHCQRRGREPAVKAGLASATGETVFVPENLALLSPTDLRRLWSLRHERGVVMSRLQRRPGILDPDLLDRLTTWGEALRNLARRTSRGGIQMIRRDGAQSLTGHGVFSNDSKLAAGNRSLGSVPQNTPQGP